jgi:hypothetical protein
MSIAESRESPIEWEMESVGSLEGIRLDEEEDSVDGGKPLLTQEQFNDYAIKYVIRGIRPVSDVVSKPFLKLVTSFMGEDRWEAAGLRLATADEVQQMILDTAADFKRVVKEALKRQSVVATTCDVWRTIRKTFIAVTCHWIDASTMKRFNCLLDVRRISHNSTGETIARILYDVHREFDIIGKVSYMTIGSSECTQRLFCF